VSAHAIIHSKDSVSKLFYLFTYLFIYFNQKLSYLEGLLSTCDRLIARVAALEIQVKAGLCIHLRSDCGAKPMTSVHNRPLHGDIELFIYTSNTRNMLTNPFYRPCIQEAACVCSQMKLMHQVHTVASMVLGSIKPS